MKRKFIPNNIQQCTIIFGIHVLLNFSLIFNELINMHGQFTRTSNIC